MNWMGRVGGSTRGRDNNLIVADLKRGIIPYTSHLADTLPVACGVAMVLQRRGESKVVLVHFGEGTTSRGDTHEAMNMAGVMKLPVIFICNNNGYAYSTPANKQYAIENISERGPAYGMPGVTIDGNDVLAVHATVGKAIARARHGDGASFIECKTYRMTGHSAHDLAEYVPEAVKQEGARKDPILRFEKLLVEQGTLTRKRVQEMDSTIQKEVDLAVAEADSVPLPDGSTAIEGVYCDSNCWWEKPLPTRSKTSSQPTTVESEDADTHLS